MTVRLKATRPPRVPQSALKQWEDKFLRAENELQATVVHSNAKRVYRGKHFLAVRVRDYHLERQKFGGSDRSQMLQLTELALNVPLADKDRDIPSVSQFLNLWKLARHFLAYNLGVDCCFILS